MKAASLFVCGSEAKFLCCMEAEVLAICCFLAVVGVLVVVPGAFNSHGLQFRKVESGLSHVICWSMQEK